MKQYLFIFLCLSCCASDQDGAVDMALDMSMDASQEMVSYDHLPYARGVVSFDEGDGAGYGQARMPDVVLGPPRGKGTNVGSLDVVSLGVGGEIVLSFGDRLIVDGEGEDFIVFENAFWAGGKAQDVFKELGEVSVSEDGEQWYVFPCSPDATMQWPGCAGWQPTLAFDPLGQALSLEVAGGDGFDLATVGLERARYVKIRDLASEGVSPSAGFDLDAVGLIHWEMSE